MYGCLGFQQYWQFGTVSFFFLFSTSCLCMLSVNIKRTEKNITNDIEQKRHEEDRIWDWNWLPTCLNTRPFFTCVQEWRKRVLVQVSLEEKRDEKKNPNRARKERTRYTILANYFSFRETSKQKVSQELHVRVRQVWPGKTTTHWLTACCIWWWCYLCLIYLTHLIIKHRNKSYNRCSDRGVEAGLRSLCA